MATEQEIKELKNEWILDPIWDIEDTDGFEDHYDELMLFRMEQEMLWHIEREKNLQRKAEKLGVPGNTKLVKYIEYLESKIERLEEKINDSQ